MSNPTLSRQRGFTLLEIMVVIVIIGLLVSIAAPNLLDNQEIAQGQKARADIATIEQSLDMYKLDNHHYPTTDQGIEALVSAPTIDPRPENYRPNGYLKRLPQDPWGNNYLYLQPGLHGQYDLYSLGADRREGGSGADADITNWK